MWLPRRESNLYGCIRIMLILHSGLFAIKEYRDSISQDDFNKAVRKMAETKKLEGKLDYQKL
jgi:26S proteasome regulatory subunit T4